MTTTDKNTRRARAIAFYLPQFHPIPENDEWWGPGFTEWSNVATARPLFPGHYQPHEPADLGIYDLRLPETRAAQAAVARAHGIEAFCYWHYWFEGRRLLERPFREVLESGEPDFPFCLAWANESWSRRWLGEERSVLMKQGYSEVDDAEHARFLVRAFADERYLRVNGRPLFAVYRPKHLPDPQRTVETIRSACAREGIADPFLLGIDAHCPGVDCRTLGFDGTVRFEPQLSALPGFMVDRPSLRKLLRNLRRGVPSARLKIYDYREARERMNRVRLDHPYFPTVLVRWDNSPRRGRAGVIMVGATPKRFGAGLREAVALVGHRPSEERLVFINAWNEWAEGNHLEPDRKFGLGFLEEVRRAVEDSE
jgi:lipopolysaccharide biosynthesis protein